MNEFQFLAPSRILENLVDEQRTTTHLLEIRNEFAQSVRVEIEMIHVDVEASTIVRAVFFKGILQKESGFSDATTAFDTD